MRIGAELSPESQSSVLTGMVAVSRRGIAMWHCSGVCVAAIGAAIVAILKLNLGSEVS